MKMFSKHVAKRISAYCNGELSDAESRSVREHLLVCQRCRDEYDEIKAGARLASGLSMVSAPDDMWNEIEDMLDAHPRNPASRTPARVRFEFNWYPLAAVSAVVIFAVVIGLVWFSGQEVPGPAFDVQQLAGNVRIDGNRIGKAGRLAMGATLETEGSSRAHISVADIGDVEVDPNSRLRLLKTQETEHRLALDRGRIKAAISAPPRLFFVDTPSAEAIDLGCVYTLEVDDAGDSLLHVSSGWVALVRGAREVWVPIHAMCQARRGLGVGTPYFEDAAPGLVSALERFDFENGGSEALSAVLGAARPRDTFTLWHLLTRTGGDERVKVLDRMIELVGLPKSISREKTLNLDPTTLQMWTEELDTVWF
jgi:hypothetical protein